MSGVRRSSVRNSKRFFRRDSLQAAKACTLQPLHDLSMSSSYSLRSTWAASSQGAHKNKRNARMASPASFRKRCSFCFNSAQLLCPTHSLQASALRQFMNPPPPTGNPPAPEKPERLRLDRLGPTSSPSRMPPQSRHVPAACSGTSAQQDRRHCDP